MATTNKPHRVLGIDPGLNITGYGVLECTPQGPIIVEAGVVRGGKGEMGDRLARIHQGIADVLQAFEPQQVALEELFSHYKRPRTAILMGHARGVICLAASQAGIPLQSFAATQVKRMLTGSGRASKIQIQNAICREFGLDKTPEPADVADALAIAVCHYYQNTAVLRGDRRVNVADQLRKRLT